jgi:hypothetical protein
VNSVVWNSGSPGGNGVASGVYFYRVAGSPEIRKMLLVK